MTIAHFTSTTSNWSCTPVQSPSLDVPGSHLVGSYDLTFTGDVEGHARCSSVMTAYGERLANGHKPNLFAGQAYFVGTVLGRKGAIAVTQTGKFDGTKVTACWTLLPETASGELQGLSGSTELEITDPTPGAFVGRLEVKLT